jgi:hypothetical protein
MKILYKKRKLDYFIESIEFDAKNEYFNIQKKRKFKLFYS